MNTVTTVWKPILTFLGVFLGQLWARAAVNGIPVIPDTTAGWVALVSGSFIAAVGVYLKANTTNDPSVAAGQSVQLRGRHELPE